jgi:hypothetical protein
VTVAAVQARGGPPVSNLEHRILRRLLIEEADDLIDDSGINLFVWDDDDTDTYTRHATDLSKPIYVDIEQAARIAAFEAEDSQDDERCSDAGDRWGQDLVTEAHGG